MQRVPISQIIGEGVEWMRRERGLVQRQLAERAGLPTHTVTSVENGTPISLDKLDRIARALGVRLSGLIQVAEELHDWRHPSAEFHRGDDAIAQCLAQIRRGETQDAPRAGAGNGAPGGGRPVAADALRRG